MIIKRIDLAKLIKTMQYIHAASHGSSNINLSNMNILKGLSIKKSNFKIPENWYLDKLNKEDEDLERKREIMNTFAKKTKPSHGWNSGSVISFHMYGDRQGYIHGETNILNLSKHTLVTWYDFETHLSKMHEN